MLFNSIDFAIFLPLVFILYWFVFSKDNRKQNILLLVSSYIFYGWWNWRFLLLIIISSIVDYIIGLKLFHSKNLTKRRLLLIISFIVNIGLLGYFKYFNFFLSNFIDAFSIFGIHLNPSRLSIVLPVGISFYTFQTLSYTIDIYRNKLEPTTNIVSFFSFVSFFPQLVAGPIERATNLLSQFKNRRYFSYLDSTDGLKQILWGLFKKIVIADNAARYVNDIFTNYSDYSGSTLFIGGILFAFQIYGDFSGYSDIAIGTAKLFGFKLMRNFAFPYFSRDIAEFWRRWHISLSTWFRDYVYIPLGGNKGSNYKKIRNIFIIFLISGFWHGANWTFIAWGFLNALYFIPLMLLNKNRKNTNIVAQGRYLPTIKEVFQMGFTFLLTTIAWLFFRASDISEAFSIINIVFSKSFFSFPEVHPKIMLILLTFLIIVEWFQREKQHALQDLNTIPRVFRWIFYYILILAIIILGGSKQEFIYFQF